MPRFRAVLVGCAIALTLPASASAVTLMVQAGAADDTGSATGCTAGSAGTYNCTTLRDAVTFANTSPSAGTNPTIKLSAGEFDLTNGALGLAVPATIIGAGDQGSSVTTIKQTGTDDDSVDTGYSLRLSDLVVTGVPLAPASAGYSGEVLDDGVGAPLTLNGVTVTGTTYHQYNGDAATGSSPGQPGASVSGGAIETFGTLTLTDSVVSGNEDIGGNGGASSATEPAGAGGPAGAVIYTDSLVMNDSVVTDNIAMGGTGGAATASTESGGTGGAVNGAGIQTGTPATITSSVISDNQALGGAGGPADGGGGGGSSGAVLGGGLYLDYDSPGESSITDTTFAGNTAEAGQAQNNAAAFGGNSSYAGGAGAFVTDGFSLDISSSTFSDNKSIVPNAGQGSGTEIGLAGSAEGGALYINNGPDVTIVNSTLSGNSAQSGTGSGTPGTIGSFGGAIEAYGGSPTAVGLYSDTVDKNTVSSALGVSGELGANLLAVSSSYTVQDTVIADAQPAGAPNCALQDGGGIIDDGRNLEDGASNTCNFIADDLRVASAGLNSLGANGGPSVAANGSTPAIPEVQTLAPAAGSPVIGHGGACTNPLAAGATSPPFPALTTDERGSPRPGTCDIGAFQTRPLRVSGTPAIVGKLQVGNDLICGGTFSATGDGAFTSAGAIGPIAFTFIWVSNGKVVGHNGGYNISYKDQGHTITCSETATGAYGFGAAASAAVHIPPEPTLTKVKQSHAKWAEKRFRHGPPVGTTFSYTLNINATVKLKFTRQVSGRKVKGKCVVETHKNAKKRSCKLTQTVGTLKEKDKAGANKIKFAGKLSGKKLPAGTYKVTLTPSTAANGTSHTLRFTVANRP